MEEQAQSLAYNAVVIDEQKTNGHVPPSFDSGAHPYQSLRKTPSFARCVIGLPEPILALSGSSDWGLDSINDRIDDRCHTQRVNGSASYCSTELLGFWL